MARFNPLDPLGLFGESNGTLVGRVDKEHFQAHQRREKSARGFLDAVWPPPDPLGIFQHRSRRSESSGATIGNPIPIEWADQVIPLKNQAREVLIGRGYRPQQVDMALHWAEEWLIGMARRLAPGNMELQKTVVVSGYADIAGRAEKWLQGIEAAFATPGRNEAEEYRSRGYRVVSPFPGGVQR